MSTKQNNKQVI